MTYLEQPICPACGRKAGHEETCAIARAEKAERALEEREADMHARIRAGYDKTVADAWRAEVAKLEAECQRLREGWAKSLSEPCTMCDIAQAPAPSVCTCKSGTTAWCKVRERVPDAAPLVPRAAEAEPEPCACSPWTCGECDLGTKCCYVHRDSWQRPSDAGPEDEESQGVMWMGAPRLLGALLDEVREEGRRKYFDKARVYGAVAARFRQALEQIAAPGSTGVTTVAKEALAWRNSGLGNGVPKEALNAFEALLRTSEAPLNDIDQARAMLRTEPGERLSDAILRFGHAVARGRCVCRFGEDGRPTDECEPHARMRDERDRLRAMVTGSKAP